MDARGGGDAGSDDASRDARDHAEILPARGAFTRYRRRPGVEGDDERYAAFLDALRARFAEDGFVFVVPDERARDDERHEDLVAAVLGEYDRTLRIAVERDDARALLRYDPQETMAHEYPGFNVRCGTARATRTPRPTPTDTLRTRAPRPTTLLDDATVASTKHRRVPTRSSSIASRSMNDAPRPPTHVIGSAAAWTWT